MHFIYLLIICLFCQKVFCLNFNEILQSKNTVNLEVNLQDQSALDLQKFMCEKQIQLKKTPLSCYQFVEKSFMQISDLDVLCLSSKVEDFSSLEDVDSVFLSPVCKQQLLRKKQFLSYRKTDNFLNNYKNHWTAKTLYLK